MSEEYYNKENEEETPNDSGSSEYGPKIHFDDPPRSPRSGKGKTTALILAVAILFSALCGVGGMLIGKNFLVNTDQAPPPSTEESTDNTKNNVIMQETKADAATLDGSVTAVVEKCASSVVEIITTPYSSAIGVTSGAGSGVIIGEDQNGKGTYIVTNNHVIEGNFTVITVRTSDGEEYTAEVVGADWMSDIAVLRIEKSGLTKATWASSQKLALGQTIIAIGNPLGSLGGSVSRGIISGVERTIVVESVPMKLLQIDAAINPGNSGGGLFDLNGNLVGIVNAKSVATNVEGIGFAIPADYAKQMVTELCEKGYVSDRIDLGFTFTGSVSVFPMYTGMGIMDYAYSDEIENAISPNDVLLTLQIAGNNAVSISSLSDYRSILVQLKEGDTVKAGIVGKKYYEVTLTAHKINE